VGEYVRLTKDFDHLQNAKLISGCISCPPHSNKNFHLENVYHVQALQSNDSFITLKARDYINSYPTENVEFLYLLIHAIFSAVSLFNP